MTVIRLRSSLPKGSHNGLAGSAADMFVREPSEMRLPLCLLDAKEIVDDLDSPERIVKVRVRRIEVIRRIMLRAHEERTGQMVLEYETEGEITRIFDAWAHEADEVVREAALAAEQGLVPEQGHTGNTDPSDHDEGEGGLGPRFSEPR